MNSIEMYDHMKPLEAIMHAWEVEGLNPLHHRAMKEQVRRSMPLLARALDRQLDGNGLNSSDDKEEIAMIIRAKTASAKMYVQVPSVPPPVPASLVVSDEIALQATIRPWANTKKKRSWFRPLRRVRD